MTLLLHSGFATNVLEYFRSAACEDSFSAKLKRKRVLLFRRADHITDIDATSPLLQQTEMKLHEDLPCVCEDSHPQGRAKAVLPHHIANEVTINHEYRFVYGLYLRLRAVTLPSYPHAPF